MNEMQRDIDELGEQLWPDAHALHPRSDDSSAAQRRPVRRRRIEVLLTAALAVALIAGLTVALTVGRQPSARPAHPVPPKPTAALSSATAAQLAAGHWSELPPAPIALRTQASVVWTGIEMLVWGGSDPNGGTYLADGAAYNPSTKQWRMLPAGPLRARAGQAAVWDGTEMLVWGGFDNPSSVVASADGAAYDPESNSWRSLPAAPLSPRARALAVWTGAEMIVLGGGTGTGGWDSLHDGAAYDPSTDSWTHISPPPVPAGHGVGWDGAVQAGHQLLALSIWANTTPCGGGCTQTDYGGDVFTFDETAGSWRLMRPEPTELAGVEQTFFTGSAAIVRGGAWCGGCAGPPRSVQTAQYDPRTDTWTSIPGDPLASAGDLLSAWTGGALFSLNAATISGDPADPLSPGNASAWDPRAGWVRLPNAPLACGGAVLWTGSEVLVYGCASSNSTTNAPGGLALVAAR